MEFEIVIGLEVHAQLKTKTKIFCGCSTAFGAAPNTHTCPVCLGMPGVLPVLNRRVVEYALKTAVATNCEIQKNSRFARKNYFYPDLPKGYQISQYEAPIARNGFIRLETAGGVKTIRINRIHMEEDAGKLIHDPAENFSRVDFNRTGVPLMEIVSEPDIRTPEEASEYLKVLHSLIRYIDVCDGNMEEGGFRCDANVSIMPKGSAVFGTRTEVKNMNSFKNVEKALAYEIERQREIIEDGGLVVQETRLWDPDRGVTVSMRGKEEAHDYRYFPDPDLLPLAIDDAWIDQIRSESPELPDDRKRRFQTEYGLPMYDCALLTGDREIADYFETCLETFPKAKPVSNWIMGSLLGLLNTLGVGADQSPVSPEDLGKLLKLVDEGVVSGAMAKTVFDEMALAGKSPMEIIEEKGLVQVSDSDLLESLVTEVLSGHPEEVESYKAGKTKLMGFFVGLIMRRTSGKANPKIVNQLLKEKLK